MMVDACPGAGKTTFALAVGKHQREQYRRRLIIIVPTAHLRKQWAESAARMGLELSYTYKAGKPMPKGFDGVVVTYAALANNAIFFSRFAAGGCVILDEPHHLGEVAIWGQATAAAFLNSEFILLISGTPFRTDKTKIPFVQYDESEPMVHSRYSYTEAITDGVCRPVVFVPYGGEVAWTIDDSRFTASFDQNVTNSMTNHRLKAALAPSTGWIKTMIEDANETLNQIRSTEHPDAGGLIVCENQLSARKIAEMVRKLTGEAPTLVLSDEKGSQKKIAKFQSDVAPWIVACNMVSEGVDIPRLRVGVFMTMIKTAMYFRQFLGRLVRRTRLPAGIQKALCYLPADPHLLAMARDVEADVRSANSYVAPLHTVMPARSEPGIPTYFMAVEGTNEGFDSVIYRGAQLPLLGIGDNSADRGAMLALLEPEQLATTAEEANIPLDEQVEQVRTEIARLVGLVHYETGRSFEDIRNDLNRRQGVRRQDHCGLKLLRQRITMLQRMIPS